ncbi:Mur ligase [Haloglomus litoreum]|uniref:Mur ligase n=1 Tax=Haloglomus litoreum TaxID=3034026 RepID=UPI0023E89C73|nr:Mur ligase [Haloglomus sp. DT116]
MSERRGRGREYRETVQSVDTRIAVSGIRGKSTLVRLLHDVLHERGRDTFAKVTGDRPVTLTNGEERPIERRGAQVTLYENRALLTRAAEHLAAVGPEHVGVAIFENHAITEYTMRVFNETFLRPQVVAVPNIRTDHTETLGRTRQDIARSFARSIPPGTHVVCGERNDAIYDYFAAEVAARDATVTRVEVPAEHRDRPGAEVVFAVDKVLAAVDEPPADTGRLLDRLSRMQPAWRRLEGGQLVFNAAKVNDPESTELFRRQLAGADEAEGELICPFVFLRGDRRGRTESFVRYLNRLADHGLVDRAHVAGENGRSFARRAAVDVTVHDAATDAPEAVLDAVLAEGQPVMTMANTVHPFMRAFVAAMQERTVESVPIAAEVRPT